MLFHDPQIPLAEPERVTPSSRWMVVLLVSVLLHLFALEWADGVIAMPNWHSEPIPVVATVSLLNPTLPTASVAPHKPRKANKPRAHPVEKPARPAAPAVPLVSEPAPDAMSSTALTQDTPTGTTDNAAADNQAASDSTTNPAPPAAADQAKADTPPENPGQPHYKVDLPPPAELKYDVTKVPVDGAPLYGGGSITWQNSGARYAVSGEAHVLFISAFNFRSEGVLDDFGIAPLLYSQKSFRRAETNTHFNRDERNSISFSSSTTSYPLKGGEQDRGSIMWELAGIGRGDPDQFRSGAQIDFFVAGVRDGDVWSILVAGQEEIEIGKSKTLAWHVVRTPRAGTYDQKIDIWLAPQFEWSPVKIRYTEKNGDYLDMSMTSFRPLLIAATPADPAR